MISKQSSDSIAAVQVEVIAFLFTFVNGITTL